MTDSGHQSRQLIYMSSLCHNPWKGAAEKAMERPVVPKVRLENQSQAESRGLGRHSVGQV